MKQKPNGYIAISSVLVILAVVLTITITGSLLSIDGAQVALSENISQTSNQVVESCVNDILLELTNEATFSGTVTLPEGSCTVNLDSQSGNNWVFSVTGTINSYDSTIQVDLDKTTELTINSWLEN